MIKIGFIHFDTIYLIHHFIGSAVELYKDPDCEVEILTPETEQEYLYSLLDLYDVPRSIVKKIPTYLYKKFAYKIQKRTNPSTVPLFSKHRKELIGYDVLVFTVFNHLRIPRNKRNPKFVFLMHGAGDRDYPFLDIYKEPISEFDLVTTSGQKIKDLFYKMGEYKHTKFEICGYQKFDAVRIENKEKILFNNNKPTVVYNPHFRDSISSFHKHGIDILEFFYTNKKYNLIFSPHFNLFDERRQDALKRSDIAKKYFESDSIIIDFGSVNSVNMSYMLSADIYLGDLSSQVYEFLINGRKPCIFFNAHTINWKKNEHYQMWQLGKIINDIEKLGNILESRDIWQKEFKEKQKKAMAYTFDISNEISSSKRVATAIKSLIQ